MICFSASTIGAARASRSHRAGHAIRSPRRAARSSPSTHRGSAGATRRGFVYLLRTPSPHTFSAHPLRTPSARPPHALRALCSVHPQPCTPLLAQLNVQKVVDALLLEEWRGDDLYQKTLTISTLLLLDPQCAALRRHPEQCPKFAEAVGSILDARPSRQRRNEPASAYMRYWAARALMLLSDEQRLVSAAIPAEALPDGELQQAPAKGVGVGLQQAPARAPLVCSNALSPSPVPGMMDVSS